MSVLPKSVQDVIVIGAGPCGAGLTKALLAENSFKSIKVFEKRSTTGGLWNYSSQEGDYIGPLTDPSSSTIALSSTAEDKELQDYYYQNIAHETHSQRLGKDFIWPSAVYDLLDTNVPFDLMAYKDTPWPDDVPVFPKRENVLKYIQEYSKPIEPYVIFGYKTIDVRQLPDSKWQVTSRPVVKETKGATEPSSDPKYSDRVDIADLVAIASGYYEVPYIPKREGLELWNEKFPGSVIHSAQYRSPYNYKDEKNILIIGNSASGADLAYQLATVLDKKIYKSIRSENDLPAGNDERIVDVPDVKKFDAETGTVEFIDGTSLSNITKVIFATGFLKSLPYLEEINKSEHPLITDGKLVHGLWRHLISIHHPGLAVIGLPRFVLPTRLSEVQGAWLARVWSGRVPVTTKEEMLKWELRTLSKFGGGKSFHDLKFPDDPIYSNKLYSEIISAGTDHGYFPTQWDEHQTKIRASVKKIKENYIDYRAKTGISAQSLQELVDKNGLVFDELEPGLLDKDII